MNKVLFAAMAKRIGFVIILALCVVGIISGVNLGDFEEVLTNASILCLSCIGIG